MTVEKRLAAVVAIALCAAMGSNPAQAQAPLTPREALGVLKAGNDRFAHNASSPVSLSLNRRRDLALAQHPMAMVLSCADSRVPPEYIFNAGLGDLFMIRTAGEVIDRSILATIEYGDGARCVRAPAVLRSWVGSGKEAGTARHRNAERDGRCRADGVADAGRCGDRRRPAIGGGRASPASGSNRPACRAAAHCPRHGATAQALRGALAFRANGRALADPRDRPHHPRVAAVALTLSRTRVSPPLSRRARETDRRRARVPSRPLEPTDRPT
jgi:hypothetical protein